MGDLQHQLLTRLLLDLFSASEMVRHVRWHVGGVEAERLARSWSPKRTAEEVALILIERGVTKADLDAIVEGRPLREDEIRRRWLEAAHV